MSNLYNRLLDRISLKDLTALCGVTLCTITLFGVLSLGPGATLRPKYHYAANQTDEWHITSSGNVRAHSRIALTHCPLNPNVLKLDLPYPDGVVESVTLEGEAIEFAQVGAGAGKPAGVYLALNTPGNALRDRLIEVIWSFPLEDLREGPNDYRTVLRGLLPIRAYSLTVVVDEGAAFEIARHPAIRIFTPFFANYGRPSQRSFGTCGLGIRRRTDTSGGRRPG